MKAKVTLNTGDTVEVESTLHDKTLLTTQDAEGGDGESVLITANEMRTLAALLLSEAQRCEAYTGGRKI